MRTKRNKSYSICQTNGKLRDDTRQNASESIKTCPVDSVEPGVYGSHRASLQQQPALFQPHTLESSSLDTTHIDLDSDRLSGTNKLPNPFLLSLSRPFLSQVSHPPGANGGGKLGPTREPNTKPLLTRRVWPLKFIPQFRS